MKNTQDHFSLEENIVRSVTFRDEVLRVIFIMALEFDEFYLTAALGYWVGRGSVYTMDIIRMTLIGFS